MVDVSGLNKRVNDNIEGISQEIDDRYFRRVQAEMHRCALNCFERPNGNLRSDAACQQQCQARVNHATAVINHCITEYQRSLKTCTDGCIDSVRYTKNITDLDEKRVGDCTVKCVDAFIAKKPAVISKTLDMLHSPE